MYRSINVEIRKSELSFERICSLSIFFIHWLIPLLFKRKSI